MVLQTVASQTVGRPAAIQVSKPMEKLDPRGSPRLPNQLPGVGVRGSFEGGQVASLCRIDVARGPLPDQLIGGIAKHCLLRAVPELQVLTDLVEAENALDVTGPSVAVEALATVLTLRHRLGTQL